MSPGALTIDDGSGCRISRTGLTGVVLAHLLLLTALLQMQVITLPAPPARLTVSLLPGVKTDPPKPPVVLPKSRPVEQQSPRQPIAVPQIAAPADSPATTPNAVAPAPTFTTQAPATSEAVATQPRFDASYLDNPKPPYPPLSRRMNESGKVLLRVRVDANGLAADVQLHTSSGVERLDASALNTVRRWKFVPARLGTEPVAATVLVPIIFSLKD